MMYPHQTGYTATENKKNHAAATHLLTACVVLVRLALFCLLLTKQQVEPFHLERALRLSQRASQPRKPDTTLCTRTRASATSWRPVKPTLSALTSAFGIDLSDSVSFCCNRKTLASPKLPQWYSTKRLSVHYFTTDTIQTRSQTLVTLH